MSSSVRPSGPGQDQRLDDRRVEVAVGLGEVGERAVGDRLVLQRQAERALEVRVDVAELERRARVAAGPGGSSSVLPSSVMSKHSRSVAASASWRGGVAGEPADEAVRREDHQARVLERDEVHQDVAVLALAADLVGVDARGLVAVVPVGDQQLGGRRARPGRRRSRSGSATRQRRLTRALGVGLLAERARRSRRAAASAAQAAPGGVAVEREDRGEVGLRRAREPQAVLLRARVRALVRADAPGAVLLDAHAREEAVARADRAVGPRVLLRERPDRGLVVADDRAGLAATR